MSDIGKSKNETNRLDESRFHAGDVAHFIPFYRRTTGSSFQLISHLFCAVLAAVISCYCSCYSSLFIMPLLSFYLPLIFRPQASLIVWLCFPHEWTKPGGMADCCSVLRWEEDVWASRTRDSTVEREGIFYKAHCFLFVFARARWSSEYLRNKT